MTQDRPMSRTAPALLRAAPDLTGPAPDAFGAPPDMPDMPPLDAQNPDADKTPLDQVFTFVLLKLASRCNIACTYCYWFRDAEVYKKPAVLTVEAEDAFCQRLEQHILTHGLDQFLVVFHGGEPLLFPKRRFIALLEKLRNVEDRTGCQIDCGLTTNATLIDREWAEILNSFNVAASVSIDGPPEIHDKYRIDFKGKGTLKETLEGLAHLRAVGMQPGMISVCNPATDPEKLIDYVVGDLGIKQFDILPPDATHEDKPPPIHDYYIKLFDVWYDRYAAQGVRISTIDAMIQGLMGGQACSETVGLGAIEIVTMMTDGTLEPHDVLRIIGDGSTASDCSVLKNPIQDVRNDPRWRGAYEASLTHCDTCRACEYFDACGGGQLAQRWSKDRGYDNPSVYCESWKRIFDHIWTRIAPTLVLDIQPPNPQPAKPHTADAPA